MGLAYYHTTESLDAIVRALEIKPGHHVLTIGGSHDAAFAMAENAEVVVSVDRSKAQIDYGHARKAMLETGDFSGFLSVPNAFDDFEWALQERDRYFLEEGRLPWIAYRAAVILFQEGDIFEAARQNPSRFSRINSSNVFGHSGMHPKHYSARLMTLAQSLVDGGLIYVADFNDMRMRAQRKGLKVIMPDILQIDREMTDIAGKYEHPVWSPVVYRKTG